MALDYTENTAELPPNIGDPLAEIKTPRRGVGTVPANNSLLHVRTIALLSTLFTGATGLIYEVTWHRYLSNLLGSQARAAAIILAVFLGGLCLGYLIFGKLSRGRSARSLLHMVAWIELGIGVWALLFPTFYELIWQNVGVLSPGSGGRLIIDLGLSIVLIGMPTILMGGTLPLLTQGLSFDLEDASVFHARVYALNTGGAFFGCLLGGFVLLPMLGLHLTMYSVAPVNLLAGFLLLLVARLLSGGSRDCTPLKQIAKVLPHGGLSSKRASTIAALAGFYAISLQIVFMRVVGISVGASDYAFSMIVAAFVLMLALGAWCIGAKAGRNIPVWVNQGIVIIGLVLVYFSVPYWSYSNHVLRTLFSNELPSFYVYHILVFTAVCLVLAIPVGAMGATMPLLFGATRSKYDELGSLVGKLYGWNTLGCVLGAICGGYVLLHYFNLDQVYRLCIFCGLTTVVLGFPERNRTETRKKALQNLSGLALILGGLVFFISGPAWPGERLGAGLFRIREAGENSYAGAEAYYSSFPRNSVSYEDGPNTTVAVYQHESTPHDKPIVGDSSFIRNLFVNAKSDGQTTFGDARTSRLAGHLPVLLSTIPVEKVAVVGFGLGITLGQIALYPEVKDIHCIEISPAVRRAAHYFDFANGRVTRNPKIRWSIDDAYRVLGGSQERYSAIVSIPSNPWVSGVEKLFAKEFYKMVHSRLEPGGVYIQWVQNYTISDDSVALITRTFNEVFPHIRFFETEFDLIMVGSETLLGEEALQGLFERYTKNEEVRASLADIRLPTAEAILARELWLSPKLFGEGPIHTLAFPRLSYSAGKDFFMAANLDVVNKVNSLQSRAWARRSASHALIGSWFRPGEGRNARLREYVKASCNQPNAKFFPNWRNSDNRCRDGLTAMAVLGIIDANLYFDNDELELLRGMVDIPGELDLESWKTLGRSMNPAKLGYLARLFGRYDTAILPLSVEKLVAITKSCDGMSEAEVYCRTQLIRTLAYLGYGSLADTAFKSYLADGGTIMKNLLEKLVAISLRAEKHVPAVQSDK